MYKLSAPRSKTVYHVYQVSCPTSCALRISCLAESGHSFGSLGGRQEAPVNKIWAILTGLGSLAFAYEFSIVLLEIQVSEVQQNESHGQSGVACVVCLPYTCL